MKWGNYESGLFQVIQWYTGKKKRPAYQNDQFTLNRYNECCAGCMHSLFFTLFVKKYNTNKNNNIC